MPTDCDGMRPWLDIFRNKNIKGDILIVDCFIDCGGDIETRLDLVNSLKIALEEYKF